MKWCSVSQIWSKPSSSVHSICSSSRWTTSSWLSPGAAWKKKKVPKRMDRRSYTGLEVHVSAVGLHHHGGKRGRPRGSREGTWRLGSALWRLPVCVGKNVQWMKKVSEE